MVKRYQTPEVGRRETEASGKAGNAEAEAAYGRQATIAWAAAPTTNQPSSQLHQSQHPESTHPCAATVQSFTTQRPSSSLLVMHAKPKTAGSASRHPRPATAAVNHAMDTRSGERSGRDCHLILKEIGPHLQTPSFSGLDGLAERKDKKLDEVASAYGDALRQM